MASIEELDSEILDIRARISAMKAQRANLSSIFLSTPHLQTRLAQRSHKDDRQRQRAAKAVKQQSTRNQENVYRACAGITAYKVQDPDPNAADNGNVLGVRIEVFVEGKFVETYHVLFNRPSSKHKTMLKIHHHTVPTCIPVKALADRWIPQARKGAEAVVEQDLVRFARMLRKELVSWHLRTRAVENLRAEAGIAATDAKEPAYGTVLNAFSGARHEDEEDESDYEDPRPRRGGPVKITSIEADMSVRDLHTAWSNGRTALMSVSKDGAIKSGVVRESDGSRSSSLEGRIVGRIEGLVERLTT